MTCGEAHVMLRQLAPKDPWAADLVLSDEKRNSYSHKHHTLEAAAFLATQSTHRSRHVSNAFRTTSDRVRPFRPVAVDRRGAVAADEDRHIGPRAPPAEPSLHQLRYLE